MKKVLSMIACLSLVVTMFAGMTVSAAEYGSPKATATFEGFVDENGDAYTAETTGDIYALVKIAYSDFENFVAYTSSGKGSNKKETVTGIAAVGIEVALEDTTNYENYGGAKADGDVFLAWGDGNANKFGGNAGSLAEYITATEGDVLQMWIAVNNKETATKLNITSAKFTVKAVANSAETASDTIELATVGCEIPAFNKPVVEEDPKVETVAAWAFDKGMLIIGKLDGEFEVGTYGVEVDGLVLGAESSYEGKDTVFETRKPASAAGYYGVQFTGLNAGTYTVRTYVGTDKGADATVAVAE